MKRAIFYILATIGAAFIVFAWDKPVRSAGDSSEAVSTVAGPADLTVYDSDGGCITFGDVNEPLEDITIWPQGRASRVWLDYRTHIDVDPNLARIEWTVNGKTRTIEWIDYIRSTDGKRYTEIVVTGHDSLPFGLGGD